MTTEHNTTNRRRNHPVFRLLDRWMYSRYDRIICISDQAEANLRAYLPNLRNVCTIYNGVNIQKFHDAKPIEGLHPEGKTVVIMVAAFRPQKDQKTLMDAIRLLPEDKYELWLVGDGELRPELEALAAETQEIRNPENQESNGIKTIGRVHFLGLRTDVPELLHTADIVVMSSHYEGLSLSSVEGMAVDKPFIATDVDGLREVVKGYGLLFPHGDSEALAQEIRKLENEEFRNQVIAKCQERAQMFDIHKMVEGYVEVYRRLSL